MSAVPAPLLRPLDAWQALVAPQAHGGLLGAPFVWGARGPAYDCWGLVAVARARLGAPVPDDWCVADHDTAAAMAVMAREAANPAWVAVDLAALAPGDIVALSSHRRIHHVGLATPWGVLHAARGVGAVLQDLNALRRSGYRLILPYRYAGPVAATRHEAAHG